MKPYEIKGRPALVSSELVRSYIEASFCVLGYHNKRPRDTVGVAFKSEEWLRRAIGTPHRVRGFYDSAKNAICLSRSLSKQEALTVVLHECIHSVMRFPRHTLEKCTSTLTAKLKPTVARIARTLFENTYKNAAHVAHTKISYRTMVDHYDQAQNRNDPVCEATRDKYLGKGRRRRAKTI